MANLKFCGPKCSIAVFLLSTWGIVQLGLMSVFFYTKSVALIEDLPLEDSYNSYSEYAQDIDETYDLVGRNCGIAALLYALTFVVSAHQVWLNNRKG